MGSKKNKEGTSRLGEPCAEGTLSSRTLDRPKSEIPRSPGKKESGKREGLFKRRGGQGYLSKKVGNRPEEGPSMKERPAAVQGLG